MGDFDGPFRGSDAISRGQLTRHQLTRHTRLHRDVYLPPGASLTPVVRARAAALWGGADAVLAGFSAAAVHGSLWIDDDQPAELFRTGSRRSTPRVLVRSATLLPGEVVIAEGLRVTSPARTAFDLGRWLPIDRAVEALDALCRATGLQPAQILTVADRHPRTPGVPGLRAAVVLVDSGAQSPPETRTRLLLVRAGLPRPQTQVAVRNELDYVVATCDLGWEQWRTAVEYDGVHHWLDERQRTRDISRYEELAELGWQVVRVNARMLRGERHVILERVRGKLRAAGCPL